MYKERGYQSLISYVFITILASLALRSGTESVQDLIKDYGLFLSSIWALPYVFFITCFRFFIGNILHIRELEKHEQLSPYVWLYDFIFISVESLLFVLMGAFVYTMRTNFLSLLTIVLFLDGIWIASMHPMKEKGWRPRVPWAWGLLNTLSGVYLVAIIYNKMPWHPLSDEGLVLTAIFFTIATIVDMILIDHYGLLKL
jgi:hypothetical protein